jgi:hypothetical protein
VLADPAFQAGAAPVEFVAGGHDVKDEAVAFGRHGGV